MTKWKWAANENKESLRKVIKRLEIIQARMEHERADILFNEITQRLRTIINMIMDSRLKPAITRKRVLICYADPDIPLSYISQRFGVTTRTIHRWAREDGVWRRGPYEPQKQTLGRVAAPLE